MITYCSRCGKELEYGARYCPACGADTQSQGGSSGQAQNDGLQYVQNSGGPQYSQGGQGMGGTLTLIFVLGIIWALVSIGSGLILMTGGSYFIFDVSGTIVVIIGLISLIGGVIALLSCIKIYKLEDFDKARQLCLIGSIIAIFTGGVIVGIVGIIFYSMMRDQKNRFSS
ncbi:MAG: zinc-ribbon domain-containing protein [Methanomassiliicoccaceae archaeon]|jgi:hypothetical protein|nr:zinc-ribbon domain-containing protein [Methanomassiliicoccaceae archaeon]